MKSGLSIVISREYLERVKRKSFIISTLLVPVLMIALMFAPALIMLFSDSESKTVAVLDDSGVVAPRLHSNDEIRFQTPAARAPTVRVSTTVTTPYS